MFSGTVEMEIITIIQIRKIHYDGCGDQKMIIMFKSDFFDSFAFLSILSIINDQNFNIIF